MDDELIKNLRNCSEINSLSRYKRDLMKQAADAIEELLAEREENYADSWKMAFEVERDTHRWIPVTERLPDYPGRFMCYYEVNDYGEIGHCIDWGKYDPDDGWYVGSVTHWMPLPQPPEDGES